MNARYPIYTAATECQDCYKCIRGCPVKAIKVERGYASVESNRCIYCGRCVETCPNGAKRVREDRDRAERLIRDGKQVIVSLAPSFVSEFTGVRPEQMVAGLRALGFWGVSETALGAQEVSARTRALLTDGEPRVLISSACPVSVEFIRKYRPHTAELLTPLFSPMLSHAQLLRTEYGDDVQVVFIGPCIAKKREADAHPELVSAALTFEDLHEWFASAGILPEQIKTDEGDAFVPRCAGNGALYPVEGGMIESVRTPAGSGSLGCEAAGSPTNSGSLGCSAEFVSVSGLRAIERALEGIEDLHPDKPLFLELLACEGGCVNGPKTRSGAGTVYRRNCVLQYAKPGGDSSPALAIEEQYLPDPPQQEPVTEAQIRQVLRLVGKRTAADELNCGGCGYDTCRGFAAAFLMGRAERRMCVTYMRKLAEKKTHALMQKMPSAVVIVDENLCILEANPSFLRFFAAEQDSVPSDPSDPDAAGADTEMTARSLEGKPLHSIVPFYNLFETVLQSGEEILGRDIRHRGRVFHVTVFTVEKNAVVGGIFRDETQPAVHKEQIIDRTRQVIEKNLQTVQQIAYLLGENAAESENALRAIVESFSPAGDGHDDELE